MGKIGSIPVSFQDLVGARFGELIVLEKVPRLKSNTTRWKCKCDCGKIIETTRSSLIKGSSKSCGCLCKKLSTQRIIKVNTKHNLSRTRIYRIWTGIKNRVKGNIKDNKKYYFDRNIKICDEWEKDFIKFYNWSIQNGYSDNLSIDRIDVNGDYKPDNCRWATIKQQNRNKQNTTYLTLNGKTLSMGEWKEKLDIPFSTMVNRKRKGLSDEQILDITRRQGQRYVDYKEMSVLLNGIVSEAKEMGIETLEDKKINSMIEKWR
jgi:hypothetical protein